MEATLSPGRDVISASRERSRVDAAHVALSANRTRDEQEDLSPQPLPSSGARAAARRYSRDGDRPADARGRAARHRRALLAAPAGPAHAHAQCARRTASRARAGAGLIQVNSLELLPWAVVVRKLFRIPVIYDCNEDYAGYMLQKQWMPRPLRMPLSRLVAILEPRLAVPTGCHIVRRHTHSERFVGRVRGSSSCTTSPGERLPDGGVASGRVGAMTSPTTARCRPTTPRRSSRRRGSWKIVGRVCAGALRPASTSSMRQKWLRSLGGSAGLERDFTLLFNVPFEHISTVLADTRFGFIPLPDTPKFRRNIPEKSSSSWPSRVRRSSRIFPHPSCDRR